MKVTAYQASFETVILRFGLMMAVGIISLMSGPQYFIWSLLCLPIFLSCILAVKFEFPALAAAWQSAGKKNTDRQHKAFKRSQPTA